MSIRFFLLGFIVLLGSSCQSSWQDFSASSTALPTRVKHSSDATVMKLMEHLRKQNVKVITIGQDYLISIPNATLFASQSPRLKWAAYDTLEEVVALLKQFRKVAITVNVYGTYYQTLHRTEVLTRARARSVANYLWSQGVDTRLLVASGAGIKCPIATCGPKGDKSPNSRTEIVFREAVI